MYIYIYVYIYIYICIYIYIYSPVLELTRGENVFDIGLSSQTELVDNVKIREQLGISDHSQIYFNIKIILF